VPACQAQARHNDTFFTGTQHYDEILRTHFDGASGRVELDPLTGTRDSSNVRYTLTNIFMDEEASTDEFVVFQSRLSSIVSLDTPDPFEVINPYVYNDGTSVPHLSLPRLEVNENSVPTAVFVIGLILSACLIIACGLGGIWVYQNRNKGVIRAAQPVFLGMMLFGTSLMAAAIIPMSFQESVSQSVANVSCMAAPWLFIVGFSMAFSAVLTKTWRVNKLFSQAKAMKRGTVRAKHVIWPFILLTATNVSVLVVWSAEAPWKFARVPVTTNVDEFGRSVESYGSCRGVRPSLVDGELVNGDTDKSLYFVITLFGMNFLLVLLSCYQSYLTRNMPSEFNELFYLSLTVSSFAETFLVVGPLLVFVEDIPTANYVVRCSLVVLVCLAILLPMFLSKIIIVRNSVKNSRKRGRRASSLRNHFAAAAAPRGSGDHSTGSNSSGLPSNVADLRARANMSNERRKTSSKDLQGSRSGSGLPAVFEGGSSRQFSA